MVKVILVLEIKKISALVVLRFQILIEFFDLN